MGSYADNYRDIDFKKHPEKYLIGKGEQGVLIAQPYKSEILPHWRFKTKKEAQKSAEHIYQMFLKYGEQGDFVGMDMARKYLQMGWTRARRYANYPDGKKYDENGRKKQQACDALTNEKAQAAEIFFKKYKLALENKLYKTLKSKHRQTH